jgi:protein-S-isoprenylcysteine O-methyltransferase Ste14
VVNVPELGQNMILISAIAIRIVWLAVEVPYLRRFRISARQDWDKHSAQIWDFANALEPIGLLLAFLGIGAFQNFPNSLRYMGLLMLTIGIAIRWAAILQLGRFFNSTVTIHKDHQIIRHGLYRFVRHPAYTGALIAHAGLGLAFGSWVSLSMSTLPFLFAALYRIKVEEQALSESFGDAYLLYQQRTARLIPKLY